MLKSTRMWVLAVALMGGLGCQAAQKKEFERAPTVSRYQPLEPCPPMPPIPPNPGFLDLLEEFAGSAECKWLVRVLVLLAAQALLSKYQAAGK